MANLREVKNRIASVSSTQQITSAMKMVAAAKLKRAQDKIIQMRPYSQQLQGILQNVVAGVDDQVESIYGEVRDTENVLLVVITSDRGLCGAFNNNVIKATNALIKQRYSYENKHNGVHILPIGKKAFEYFTKRNYQVVGSYYQLFSDLSFDQAKIVGNHILNGFALSKYDKVELIYNEFQNVATQILQVNQMLPLSLLDATTRGHNDKDIETLFSNDLIFEPSLEYVVNELIPQSLNIQFYKAVLESNAAEHGARMTAMEQATDNAGELLKELKLKYNRTRQAAITNEILEIVGGAEALASS